MTRLGITGLALVLAACGSEAQDGRYAPPSEVLQVHDYVAAVSADRIETDIRQLAGFGTRHTLSDTESETRGVGAATRWIYDEFQRISAQCGGCLSAANHGDAVLHPLPQNLGAAGE